MTLLGHALRAGARGFCIFPTVPSGKTPGRIYPHRPQEEAPWTIKWSEVATINPGTIVNWWNQSPEANIGIACSPSRLLVVDCDLKQEDGVQQWLDIVSKFSGSKALNTYTTVTGSGGLHFYYWWPVGIQASQSGLASAVDIRSNGGQKGGYVLGAGSITEKGPYEIDSDAPILNAPPWLVELCREKPRPKPVRNVIEQPNALSFAGLQTKVATAPEGDRNACLLWAARAMCSDQADESECLHLLVPAAVDNGLSEREASDTIRSAYRLQSQKDGR